MWYTRVLPRIDTEIGGYLIPNTIQLTNYLNLDMIQIILSPNTLVSTHCDCNNNFLKEGAWSTNYSLDLLNNCNFNLAMNYLLASIKSKYLRLKK